jgi:protein-S-isoprenylcysteine O-methyltransferase Ste14
MMSHVVSHPAANSRPQLNKYGYNCIGKHIGMVLVAGGSLFMGVGTLQWDWAWLFTVVTLIGWVVLSLVLARVNPEILNERGKRSKALVGTKRWDWIIMTVYAVLLLAVPFVAGLDYRYGWSAPTSDAIKAVGILVLAISFIPLTWSMAVNRFFEATVRIQENRGHQVITSGPYRYVRHPGYVGVILQFIAVPLSLGTLVAWIPALLGVGLYVLRTRLEDRTLIAELPGYADYAQRTRYRLVPGVW